MAPLRPSFVSLSLSLSLAIALASCGGAACPAGRVKGEAGQCVPEDIVDFVACVRAAGGASIDRESAKQISASAYGVSGAVGWQDRVKTEYAGPAAENQRIVIEACIARTHVAPVDAAPPKHEEPTIAVLAGAWVAARPDGLRNELDIEKSGEFRARQHSASFSCSYQGMLRLEGKVLVRTVQQAECAGPIGTADRLELVFFDERQFVVATPDGEVTYVRR